MNARRQLAAFPAAVRPRAGTGLVSAQYGQYSDRLPVGMPRRRSRPTGAHRRTGLAHTRAASSARATHWANRSPVVALGRRRSGPPARRSRADRRAVTLWPRTLRPKPASRPSPPPRCTWKPSTWSPSGPVHELALETDVGDLDPGAGVRAAVDVDGDAGCRARRAGVSSSSTTRCRLGLGLDDGELAELDAGAGHHRAPEGVRPGRQAELLGPGDQGVDPVRRDVEDQHLLHRRWSAAGPSRAPRRGRRARSAACRRSARPMAGRARRRTCRPSAG